MTASAIPEYVIVKHAGPTWSHYWVADPKDGTDLLIKDGVGGVHGAKWTTYRGKTDWFHHTNLGWLPSAKVWQPLPV